MEMRSLEFGVVTSGISYLNVRESLPEYSTLKIGMTYPVPRQMIRNFASQVKYLYVVEENRPFLEEEILALGIPVDGKQQLLRVGELSATELRRRIKKIPSIQKGPAENVPKRPPQFCPGCGHRGIFYLLKKHTFIVNGDIGCYGLAALPPYDAMDTLIDMGASIGMDHGMRKVATPEERSVAVIGDSTFFHSGMTNVANVVNNAGSSTVVVLDNRVTAMTGHQPNPTTGRNAKGAESTAIDIAGVCRAFGVAHVVEVDAYDMPALEKALMEETARREPSVIVVRQRCVIVERKKHGPSFAVGESCKRCKVCLRLGCPAISMEGERVVILEDLCDGCGLCASVCPAKAIAVKEAHS
jgi:indolepyruvate ferredoxin oxidoreductase alpha subunit